MHFAPNPHHVSEILKIGGLCIQVNSDFDWGFFHHKQFSPFFSKSRFHDIQWNFNVIQDNRFRPHHHGLSSGQVISRQNGSAIEPESQSPPHAKTNGVNTDPSDWVIRIDHEDSSCLLDFDAQRADISVIQSKAPFLRNHIISPHFLAPFLPGFQALMLHASAIVRRGRTAVFLALDEGGKSTAARLSPKGIILGDDQIIVRRNGKGFCVFGTPWGLYSYAGAGAPLSGLFLLKKATTFSLAPLETKQLIPFIWKEIQRPLAILPNPLKKKAFSLVCDLVDTVPTWEMAFPRDFIDWNTVDRKMMTHPRAIFGK